jgi:hypothetical protein
MSDFATNLSAQLAAHGSRNIRLLVLLNTPDSPRKTRRLARMEQHVRVHLGMDQAKVIDWSKIDWPTLFADILQLIMAIMPLLLTL